jgi:hypothetical protein
MDDFKPNLYPIMYWALLYGLAAGLLLFAVFLLSQFVTVVWFPVFVAGVIWGGYRNYQKQKRASGAGQGTAQRPLDEFKEAAQDIISATREMMTEGGNSPAATDTAPRPAEPSREQPQPPAVSPPAPPPGEQRP